MLNKIYYEVIYYFDKNVNCKKKGIEKNKIHYQENKKNKFFPSPFQKAIKSWFNENGEFTYRLNYPSLNSNSLVLDLGGCEGNFTYRITKKYDCNVMVFEFVPKFVNFISERFSDNSKVKVFCFGLEDRNSEEELYIAADGSSVCKNKNSLNSIVIKYKDVIEFLKNNICLM